MDIVDFMPHKVRCNQYIFTILNHFTKHVEASLHPDQKPATIARVFLNELDAEFKVRYVMHTNQYANFE